MKVLLTPRELAEAIGASESSVKRWVDSGLIEAMRTAGGHRRITLQEAGRYIRENAIPLVRPDRLGFPDLEASGTEGLGEGNEADRLLDYLQRGADAEARGLLLTLYLQGWSVAEIIDRPLRTAMERIGELWTREPSGIFWEHRATQIAIQALGRLRSVLKVPSNAPFAVVGAPLKDPYILPSMAVAAVLEGEGMRAVNLGAETPMETLALGVRDLHARLACVSVSVAREPEDLREQILELLGELVRRGTPLVVGGADSRKLRLAKHDNLLVGGSMAELEALVKGMKLASTATDSASSAVGAV